MYLFPNSTLFFSKNYIEINNCFARINRDPNFVARIKREKSYYSLNDELLIMFKLLVLTVSSF